MKKKLASLLMALVMALNLLPISVWADSAPFTPSTGTVDGYTPNGYTYTDTTDWNNPVATTTDLYSLTLPAGTQELTLTFSADRLAYGYGNGESYIAAYAPTSDGSYANGGQTGATTAVVKADSSGAMPPFVRVQTPYDASWQSQTLYAIAITVSSAGTDTPDIPDQPDRPDAPTVSTVDRAALLRNIAASYTTTNDPMVAMDMAAYNGTKLTGYENYAQPKKSLGDAATGKTVSGLASVDVTGDYAIYTIPYLELAYQAGGVSRATGHDAATLRGAMVDYLNGIPDNYADTDEVAVIISALATYYKSNSAVKSAVDKAVSWLSETKQNDDGSFSYWGTACSESTALVITSLCALGINPHTDSRFVKDGNSALDGLLQYALSDNSGFGHDNSTSKDAIATEQGFRALVAYEKFSSSGYNIYTAAKNTSGGNTGGNTGGSTDDSKPQSTSITVSVSVKSDTGYWLSNAKVTLSGTSPKASDAFIKACSENGLSQSGAEDGYVRSVTKAGKTLREFGQGSNSGWLYKVNGALPKVGISSYAVKNGDHVLLYYTSDWTQDSSAGSSFSGSGSSTEDAAGTDSTDTITDNATDAKPADTVKPAAVNAAALQSANNAAQSYLASLGTPTVGSTGGEWAVLALLDSGSAVGEDYYNSVLSFVSQNIDSLGRLDPNKSTENSRLVLSLTALGYDVTDVDGHDLLQCLSDFDYLCRQGINGPIWALIALDSGAYPVPATTDGVQTTRPLLVRHLLDNRTDDGGWSLSGDRPDADLTAMALTALSPYYHSGLDAAFPSTAASAAPSHSDIKSAVDEALTALSSLQHQDGSFSGNGEKCAESCAQVVIALCALGIDPHADPRFVKDGHSVLSALLSFATKDGFCHTQGGSVDAMASEQAALALSAYNRLRRGDTRSVYTFSQVVSTSPIENTPHTAVVPTEELNQTKDDPKSSAPSLLWLALAEGAVILLLAVFLLRRKRI